MSSLYRFEKELSFYAGKIPQQIGTMRVRASVDQRMTHGNTAQR